MYADLVRDIAAPAVQELYLERDAICQDDPASINRCEAALTAVSFNKQIDSCPKLSDVWTNENVWGILNTHGTCFKT